MVKKGNAALTQVLVRSGVLPPECATWEDYSVLRACFPLATVWGHPVSHGGGSVTPVGVPPEDAGITQQRYREDGLKKRRLPVKKAYLCNKCVCARALRPDRWVVLRGLNYVWNTAVTSSIIKSKKRDELPQIPSRVHTSGGRRLTAAKSLDAGKRGVTGIGAGRGGRGCAHQDGCGQME